MIKAVLFDLGGTIHTVTRTPERTLRFAGRILERLADYGIRLDVTPEAFAAQLQLDSERYKAEVEESMRELEPDVIWSEYYLKPYNISRERIHDCAEELSFLYDYERPLNMRRLHLLETMDALRSDGIRLGVISNIISRSIVPLFMVEYDLARYMECVITSADVGWRKPSANIFRVAEEAMQLRPEELAYVGDTLSRDVRGVRNAGWRCVIQIEHGATAFRDKGLRELGYAPDHFIHDLIEIPEIIRRENRQ